MTRARSNDCRASRCRPSALRISPRLLSCVARSGWPAPSPCLQEHDRPIDVRQRLLVAPQLGQRRSRCSPRRRRRRGARAPSAFSFSASASSCARSASCRSPAAVVERQPRLLSNHACSSSCPPKRCSTASAVFAQRSASSNVSLPDSRRRTPGSSPPRRAPRRGATHPPPRTPPRAPARRLSSFDFSSADPRQRQRLGDQRLVADGARLRDQRRGAAARPSLQRPAS